MATKIEWCDEVWNPVTGCTKVSPGCASCYAEALFPRPYPGRPFSDVRVHADRLDQPYSWRKPRRVFVNSMSDLFHEAVSDRDIARIFQTMERTPRHSYQVLTKRPERMRDFMAAERLPNVWLGVSVEDQRRAGERIPILLDTPAAVRFVSAEPLLAAVDLARYLYEDDAVDWVICGGESGPKARPCALQWVERIVGDCREAGVPVFVKQLGARPVAPDYTPYAPQHKPLKLRNRKGGDPAEWPPELRVREFPR